MGIKLRLTAAEPGSDEKGTKLIIPADIDLHILQKYWRPDVLHDPENGFQYINQFKAFVPKITYEKEHETDKVKILKVTNLSTLGRYLNNNNVMAKLYNKHTGETFSVPFNDIHHGIFEVGVIVVKHHRSNRKRSGKRLTPWINDNGILRPRGAAICWGGSPGEEVYDKNSNTYKYGYIKFSVDWLSKKIKGFEDLLIAVYPRPNTANYSNHDCYFFGIIFRIKNPYTGEYITTQPSDLCVCSSSVDWKCTLNGQYFIS